MNEESILKLNKWFAEKYHIEWVNVPKSYAADIQSSYHVRVVTSSGGIRPQERFF